MNCPYCEAEQPAEMLLPTLGASYVGRSCPFCMHLYVIEGGRAQELGERDIERLLRHSTLGQHVRLEPSCSHVVLNIKALVEEVGGKLGEIVQPDPQSGAVVLKRLSPDPTGEGRPERN